MMRVPTVALALLVGMAMPATAQQTQSAVTTSSLNIRGGPSAQHPVVGWVPKGQVIQLFNCTSPVAWCQTVFNNVHGWVSANHLSPRPSVVAPMPPVPVPPPGGSQASHPDIPLVGPGFRTADDLCRRAGESSFTGQFLGSSGDLVACPPGTDPRLFAFETGGKEVAQRDGWILFTVPRQQVNKAPVPPAGISLFGPGFRTADDMCRRAGESDFTNPFLGAGSDVVACPPGTDPNLFAFETGGREVARRDGWILFTVPRR